MNLRERQRPYSNKLKALIKLSLNNLMLNPFKMTEKLGSMYIKNEAKEKRNS